MTIFENFYNFLIGIFGTDFTSTDFGTWCVTIGAVALVVLTLTLVYKFFKGIINSIFRL